MNLPQLVSLALVAAVLSRAEFGPGAVPGVAAEALADALAFLETEDGDLDAGLMAALLAAEPWGYLHAHLVPPRGRAFFFRVDERQPEPVSFGRQVRRGDRYDLLSQYAIEDAARPPGFEEDGDLVEVRHVEVVIVPLLLDFRDDGWARVRVRVAGPVTELELPPLPRRPDRIVFGDLDSVLAEVKDRGWRR